MTLRRKMEIAGALAVGLLGATIDTCRILHEAAHAAACEYRLAVMLSEAGLHRDDVMVVSAPEGDWVIMPDGTGERIG